MIHHIQNIGEVDSRLSSLLRDSAPSAPCDDVIAMRNVLVHMYFGIDPEEVRDLVATDLPGMKSAIEAVLVGSR